MERTQVPEPEANRNVATEPPGPTGEVSSDISPIQRRHGTEILRGLQTVPRSISYEGRFGRLFRALPPCIDPAAPENDRDALAQLAQAMLESADQAQNPQFDNQAIPAGYTYLGQFVDHDITFDPNSKLQRQNDPNALRNFRTPRYDLDSVYGSGPDDAPYLYQNDGIHFLIGKVQSDQTDDLPRNMPLEREPRRALIGDPRNDENLIVSQLHLAFLKFHNRVIDELAGSIASRDQLFDEARRVVRWHYQWVVVHDFLRRIVGNEVVDDILQAQGESYKVATKDGIKEAKLPKINLKFYDYHVQPFMPVEFSVATYRFGHSQVRPAYDLNDVVRAVPIFSLDDENPLSDLRGFRERPADWDVEWQRYFRFPNSNADLQLTRKINTQLAPGLATLPPSIDLRRKSLAERNLRRSKALALPSGQAVAEAMGIPPDLILTGDALGLPAALKNTFGENTPLWFYILREAEVLADGTRLGPVGGRITAEVLIGLLEGDPLSYLSAAPTWRPEPNKFGAGPNGEFTMVELLRFARAGRNPQDEPKVIRIGGRAIVSANNVRLRATPGTQGRIVTQLSTGTTVTIIDGPQAASGRDWWKARLDDNREGWVAAEFLQPA